MAACGAKPSCGTGFATQTHGIGAHPPPPPHCADPAQMI